MAALVNFESIWGEQTVHRAVNSQSSLLEVLSAELSVPVEVSVSSRRACHLGFGDKALSGQVAESRAGRSQAQATQARRAPC